MDKIANREARGSSGIDVSEKVSSEILPIVEGTIVNTNGQSILLILFIGAGAFTVAKPQDLIPELQGASTRVELDALTGDDFVRILTEPKNALVTHIFSFWAPKMCSLSSLRMLSQELPRSQPQPIGKARI